MVNLEPNQNATIMKKAFVGALVGGIIIFIWQFISFAAANFHKPAQQYTDKQDEIMSFLSSQGLKEGGYVLPIAPESASHEEMEQQMKNSDGKPWATIQYHDEAQNSMNDMLMNMLRGLLVNIVVVWMFCWMVGRMNMPSFTTVLLSALATGLIVFFNAPYINHIWYKTFDIWAFFIDYVVSWGLTGLWLAWWLRRGQARPRQAVVREREMEMSS